MSVGDFELVAITSGSMASDDVLAITDVHDATQSPQGSTKKTVLAQLYLTQTVPVTVSTPLPDIAQTWNASGVVFTAVRVNVTNTASASGSLLLDVQVGGTSQWKVDKTGAVTQASGLTVTTGGITVSAGTTAVQALTATTGVLTGAVTVGGAGADRYDLSRSGSFPSLDYNNAAASFRLLTTGASAAALTMGALTSGAITVTGNSTITGTLGGLTGLTVASGGATITSGGLTVSAGTTAVQALTATTGTFTGLLLTAAATTGSSGFRIPVAAGVPSSPVNGDMWSDNSGIYFRLNGVTKTFTVT